MVTDQTDWLDRMVKFGLYPIDFPRGHHEKGRRAIPETTGQTFRLVIDGYTGAIGDFMFDGEGNFIRLVLSED